ncbi:MAG: hypothetical protein ABIY55_11875 [Kofleriaceae bacterium]
MEQQGAAIRPHAVMIAVALSKDEYSTALLASGELHRALDAFVATTERLHDHVIAQDGMGELGESIGELALRARGLVVLKQLDALCSSFRDPAVQARSRGWFVGQIHEVAQVKALIRDMLTKIHAIWLPYRQDQPALPGMIDAERASVYRTTVRAAQRALRDLRDEPDLARFLDAGMAATDLPEVHLACKQIHTMLGLEIDTEPRGTQPRRRHRLAARNGAPEQR